MRMPLATHLELWSAAPRKVLTQSPYAALLVSMHGHALYARRDTTEPDTDDSRAVKRFVTEQEAFQRDLLARLDEDPDRARANQKLVWALDFLSLAPIMGWFPEDVPAPTARPIAVSPPSDRAFTADPWPFDADEFSVRYQGRRLDRPAESEHRAPRGARRRALGDRPLDQTRWMWCRSEPPPAHRDEARVLVGALELVQQRGHRRAPVEPSGWPSAIAPPLTLTRSMSGRARAPRRRRRARRPR